MLNNLYFLTIVSVRCENESEYSDFILMQKIYERNKTLCTVAVNDFINVVYCVKDFQGLKMSEKLISIFVN